MSDENIEIYKYFAAMCLALVLLSIPVMALWVGWKSGECHQAINIDVMKQWNISPTNEGKTICDSGDVLATKTLPTLDAMLIVLGVGFLYLYFKKKRVGAS